MSNKRNIIKKYTFNTNITYEDYKKIANALLMRGFLSEFTYLSNCHPDYLDREAEEILEEIRKSVC